MGSAKLNTAVIDDWLAQAKTGGMSWHELAERILQWESEPGLQHRPDHDRARRCGFGEVIFGAGKDVAAIQHIATAMLDRGQGEVLVTRVGADTAKTLETSFPHTRYDELGRILRLSREAIRPVRQLPCPAPTAAAGQHAPALQNAAISVVTAGSTDLPVAREALETLRWMGVDAELICDVGVAGPYRLLAQISRLRTCHALVVVAGMEGALASVVGGLVSCPVIAVPTSIGYGANLAGITTLLSMLSSCAAGVTVVNIDAGFKGGYVAGLIAHQVVAGNAPADASC